MATEARAPLPEFSLHANPALKISTTSSNSILCVSGTRADHKVLVDILDPAWHVHRVCSPAAARDALRDGTVSIVIWDTDSMGGEWRALATESASWTAPPQIIVASRNADACLWAEALNLGAWDVLAKPYDAQEVSRVLNAAFARGIQQLRSAAGGR